jgi:hypothetical protein
MVEKVDEVPLAGLPPVTAHAYEYGDVPPLTVELKLNAVLTEPDVGPMMETVRGVDEMLMRWNAEAVLALWSVTVRVTL